MLASALRFKFAWAHRQVFSQTTLGKSSVARGPMMRSKSNIAVEKATFTSVQQLLGLCQLCVSENRSRFIEKNGRFDQDRWADYESWYDLVAFEGDEKETKVLKLTTPRSSHPWIDFSHLCSAMKLVDDIALIRSSEFATLLLSSPVAVSTTILKGDGYSMSLLCIPGGGEKRIRLARHESGVAVIYKPLQGFGHLETIDKDLKIQHHANFGYEHERKESSKAIIRYGGRERELSVLSSRHLMFLEVALSFYPNPQMAQQGKATAESLVENTSVGKLQASFDVPLASFGGREILSIEAPQSIVDAGLFGSEKDIFIKKDLPKDNDVKPMQTVKEDRGKYNIMDKISKKVGGLSEQIGDIVRRVLTSRQLTPEILRALGLSHVKGVLLYGPPGTGKTLIAREMARALNSREPVLVNGPDIMDKYVGEAERKIRDVFQAAEEEWAAKGRDSELHVIIFDEFDAIAKRRGSFDTTGVRDSCVNQLLTKLDGVEEMNNVLVIALTNRKDLIDPALLRPGRLEVHMKIEAPDIHGREEILFLLFKPLVKGGFVSAANAKLWALEIAAKTPGWTGAELSGLMRSAASFAIERNIQDGIVPGTPGADAPNGGIVILADDLNSAFEEVSKDVLDAKTAGSIVRSRLVRSVSEPIRRRLIRYGLLGADRAAVEIPKRYREFEEILNEEEEPEIQLKVTKPKESNRGLNDVIS